MVQCKNAVENENRARADKPYFDIELRELWVNGVLVKSLDCRATNQILILSAFQEDDWPLRIDDPLSPKNGSDEKGRLRSTIHSLNGCQHTPVIRFFADGTARGIRWTLIPSFTVRSPSGHQNNGRILDR